MTYTMEDFEHDYIKEHFARLTPQERRDALKKLRPEERRELVASMLREEREGVLRSLPLEERLADVSPEQLREYLDKLTARQPASPRKPKRKK